MIIEAICDHGVVQMPAGLKFKHEKFTVKIELPEAELNSTRPDASSPSEIRRQLDIILGPYKDQLKSGVAMTVQDYQNIWHEHLEEKYLGRS